MRGFFVTHGGKTEANVISVKPKSSPISSGGLEIMLKVTFSIDDKNAKILIHLKQPIEENYEPDIDNSSFYLQLLEKNDHDNGNDSNDDGVLFIDVEADDDGVVDIDDQGDDGVEKE